MMIHYQGEKIGLLNDKNVDWDMRTSESGIFLGRTEYYNTFVPYLVSVAGIETTFYQLGWVKQCAHILKANVNAVKFNLQLGYELAGGQEELEHQRYEMTRDSFERKAVKVRKAVNLLAGNDRRLRVILEPDDYQLGLAQKFEALIKVYSPGLEKEVTSDGNWYREPAFENHSI
jgi:hypothetical protein